ncbi:FAD-dependent oxidoreductase [Loigolactobacillus jiayinensis]|uniref:FAD-dependent oxidoreductase n=1 Tax=Loigolactobacillus jiayinensis TaxID=2486016 RepID=A0ABW1RHB4_9LACO|nr:FAD-dependent oxidoreductase [Loigolactobacillus jiayinensis]
MIKEYVSADIVIIGGGLAGICAAISSARVGRQVILVQNRSLLGGNSSSEIRVWVGGATKHGINRYARETGIMGELFLENQYRNPDGNPYIWDLLLLEKVRVESNIQLFLNTEISQVTMDTPEKIASVTGRIIGSEREITFSSGYFIDSTGDGLVAFAAGADYHLGREAQSEYGESLAPKKSDHDFLGSSLFFYTKNVGHPVKFIKPFFARDITKTEIVKSRIIQKDGNGCDYWWIEWGGELDIVHDNEKIRDELQAAVYGIWDYIKNSGKYDADNLTLEWVGSLPGKREYRRFIGDYVLTQQDIEEQTDFPDKVAFGGWSIDIHPASGMYTKQAGTEDSVPDGVYHIPFRTLYSHNIHNLLLAGRDISVSHVAFGSTRVMATCAVCGQAAGLAAAFAYTHKIQPRDIYQKYLADYQQYLLKEDSSVLGIKNQDDHDLARQAKIEASHTLTTINTYSNDATDYPLIKDVAFLFPVDPKLDNLELFVKSSTATKIELKFYQTGKRQNYIPAQLLKSVTVSVPDNYHDWLTIPIEWQPEKPENIFVVVSKNPLLTLAVGQQAFQGVLSFINEPVAELNQPKLHHFVRTSPILHWTNQLFNRRNFVFRIRQTSAFTVNNILNGYVRPFSGPNLWVTNCQHQPETITLKWSKPQLVHEIRLTLNDDVNEDLINLHHHYTAFPVMPELIKDLILEAYTEQGWQKITAINDNRQRHLIVNLTEPIELQQIRLRLLSTNGSQQISLYEIRVY